MYLFKLVLFFFRFFFLFSYLEDVSSEGKQKCTRLLEVYIPNSHAGTFASLYWPPYVTRPRFQAWEIETTSLEKLQSDVVKAWLHTGVKNWDH